MFIAIWQDRHADTTAHLFTEKQPAIDWARKYAREYCPRIKFFDESWEDAPYTETSHPLAQMTIREGFVYVAFYSIEGDKISVMEVEPDAEVDTFLGEEVLVSSSSKGSE